MMIVQPGKDYQVTVEDDLVVWKKRLEGKRDITFKVYDELNHLLIEAPETYAKEGYVDEGVVGDICAWIREHSGASV